MSLQYPKRRKRERSGIRDDDGPIRCASHLQSVRGHECCIKGRIVWVRRMIGDVPQLVAVPHVCSGPIQAMHVRTGTDGGTSLKPGDNWTIPGCDGAHREQHQIGEKEFEKRYGIDMEAIAAKLWEISPAGKRYRMQHAEAEAPARSFPKEPQKVSP